MKFKMLTLLLLTFSVTGFCSELQLQFKPKQGESFRITEISKMVHKGEKKEKSLLKFVYHLNVANVDSDGKAALAFTIQGLAREQEGFSFDSEKNYEQGSDRERAYAQLLGKSFTFIYEPGKGITEVQNLQPLYDSFTSVSQDPKVVEMLLKDVKSIYNEELMKESFTMFALSTPKAVSPGESWERSANVDENQMHSVYTLKGWDKDFALVKQKGSFASKNEKAKFKGSVHCLYQVYTDTGWIHHGRWIFKNKGKSSFEKKKDSFSSISFCTLRSERLF